MSEQSGDGLSRSRFKKFNRAERGGPGEDEKRKKRIEFLVKATLYADGDIEAFKATIPPDKLQKMIEADSWFGKDFNTAAGLILEEGIMLNLVEMATSKTAQTLPAAKTILPALNKRRWNLGVQKQETANEGVGEFLKMASDKPMNRQELIGILMLTDPKFITVDPAALKVLSLSEAIAIEKQKVIEVQAEPSVPTEVKIDRHIPPPEDLIKEDEDLVRD